MKTKRIDDKIQDIERYLVELHSFLPNEYELYKEDTKIKAASERYFEKIVEAVIDVAFLVIRNKNLKLPEDDKQALDILAQAKIISEELAGKLKDAHQYDTIDDEIVFNTLREELEKDVEAFLRTIDEKLKTEAP